MSDSASTLCAGWGKRPNGPMALYRLCHFQINTGVPSSKAQTRFFRRHAIQRFPLGPISTKKSHSSFLIHHSEMMGRRTMGLHMCSPHLRTLALVHAHPSSLAHCPCSFIVSQRRWTVETQACGDQSPRLFLPSIPWSMLSAHTWLRGTYGAQRLAPLPLFRIRAARENNERSNSPGPSSSVFFQVHVKSLFVGNSGFQAKNAGTVVPSFEAILPYPVSGAAL